MPLFFVEVKTEAGKWKKVRSGSPRGKFLIFTNRQDAEHFAKPGKEYYRVIEG